MTLPQDLNSEAGLAALNDYLKDKSYIEGHEPSQADVAVYEALSSVPNKKHTNVSRWYSHISSFQAEFNELPGEKKAHTAYGCVAGVAVAAAAAAATTKKEDEDDIDLFGSDEEEDAELERLKAERVAEYNAKKSKKPALIAKSSAVLDVKPWDDTTDMKAMEEGVRAIAMDGLLWGASKLVPVGYGVNKLQITCVIEDDKVGMDILEEEITAMEDYVQSVDIFSFNKI